MNEWVWDGYCGWGMVSPTREGPAPLKGQACKEVPKGLSMGTKSPSWEAVTSTGTARGEWGGREGKHLQPQTTPCILAHPPLSALLI